VPATPDEKRGGRGVVRKYSLSITNGHGTIENDMTTAENRVAPYLDQIRRLEFV